MCNKQSDKGVSLLCRLAAELESEVPAEGPAEGHLSEGMQEAVPFDGEVLEKLRGMEQQVQMALLELKKKDQQLAREKSSTGRFKVRRIYLAIKLSVPCASLYVAVSVCLSVCLWETTFVTRVYFQMVHVTVTFDLTGKLYRVFHVLQSCSGLYGRTLNPEP
jgi:hypothetical protein